MKKITRWILTIAFLTGFSTLAQTPAQLDGDAIKAMMESAQNMGKDQKRLKALVPLTNELLINWLPESLGKLDKVANSVKEIDPANLGSISVSYNLVDEPEFITSNKGGEELNARNKTFHFEIMDGAGPTGSALLSSIEMMSHMNAAMSDESKEQKEVSVDGIKVQQIYDAGNNKTDLSFIYKERFAVTIDGSYMNPEETWAKVKKMGLNKLMDLTE